MQIKLRDSSGELPSLAATSAEEIFLELDRANVGMALINMETRRFLRVNAKLCEITGYPREELVRKTAAELTHPEDKQLDRDSFDRFVRGEVDRRIIEKRYVRKDGSPVWVHVTTSIVHLGGKRFFFGITEDITARKLADEALRRALAEAQIAKQALQQADRRKDDFLAMLAHELRNPLSSVHNAAEVLASLKGSDPIRDRMQNIIARQARNLARLVDDLLDVTRIRTGKIALKNEDVRLTDVITGAVETTRPLIESRAHQLTVHSPSQTVWLRGDEVRLIQVIGNLLNNAAKYTPSGGRIEITAESDGQFVVVRVQDSGVGIPPDVLPNIFNLFEQADASLARTEGGLGIGLTIVKNLVELHGGSVRAESQVGRGTTLEVRLPCTQTAHAVKADRRDNTARVCKKVLVVEDNADAAESLGVLLELHGHDVRTAKDGSSALDLLAQFQPDVLVMDIGLPGMDGYELARRMKRIAVLDGSLLIAVSGYGEATDKKRSAEAGYDFHFVKPVDISTLEATIACHAR